MGRGLSLTMRYFLISLIFALACLAPTRAQIQDHTTEVIKFSRGEVKTCEEIELVFEVNIKQDWYIYSTEFKAEEPTRAEFTFAPDASYQLVGKVQPINPKRKFDDTWGAEVAYFEKKAEFRQKIKVLSKDLKVAGSFLFQTCSNVTGMCLRPETVPFSLNASTLKIAEGCKKEEKQEKPKEPQDENPKEEAKSETKDTIQKANAEAGKDTSLTKPKVTKTAEKEKTTQPINKGTDSLLGFMFLAFLGGFSAIFTPCVFPMIPMTVTFFTKDRKKKKTDGMSEAVIKALERKYRREALKKVGVYAISIIAIYTILGVFFSAVFGAGFNNWLSTHWLPNLFFFCLLLFFGLSFLGMYEIVLPSSWVNAVDKQADKGGYVGVFFMAFTLALVSFSCTAPIVGTLLVAASGGAIIKPVLGMIAFSTAVALPFALFAAFPTWLNGLPKSGGWLNAVKVTLGFLEVAFSLKFLSQADLVYHWGILNRDIFIAIWIVLFSLLGFYLLGKLRLPHDSPVEKIPVPRLLLAIFAFSFVVYMVPGLFGAPLKLLSGYLPPESTLEWTMQSASEALPAPTSMGTPPKYSEFLKLPHRLQGFFDMKEALAESKKVGKPIFIDFTGHGCVNCRKMEANVWSDKEVLKRLREDYVMLALYTDDRHELPKSEWYEAEQAGKKIQIRTIGDLYADYQIQKFQINAQPYYCLIDSNENLLVPPKDYDLKVANFVAFLDEGKKAFQAKK